MYGVCIPFYLFTLQGNPLYHVTTCMLHKSITSKYHFFLYELKLRHDFVVFVDSCSSMQVHIY